MIRTALVASLALSATAHAQSENQVYVETTDQDGSQLLV